MESALEARATAAEKKAAEAAAALAKVTRLGHQHVEICRPVCLDQ